MHFLVAHESVGCTPISEGLLARIVAETGSKLYVRNSVWTAPVRADRMLAILRKTCPGNTFLNDFGVVLGTKSSHLGHFGFTMALVFAAGFGVVVGVMEPVGNHARLDLGQRSKSIYPARHMIRSSLSIYLFVYL